MKKPKVDKIVREAANAVGKANDAIKIRKDAKKWQAHLVKKSKTSAQAVEKTKNEEEKAH